MQLLTFNIVIGQHIYKSGTTGLLSLYTENFNIKGLVQIGIMGHEPNLLGDQFDQLVVEGVLGTIDQSRLESEILHQLTVLFVIGLHK